MHEHKYTISCMTMHSIVLYTAFNNVSQYDGLHACLSVYIITPVAKYFFSQCYYAANRLSVNGS